MKVIACLGNPGKKYRRNRHNIGFIIAGLLSEIYNITLSENKFSSVMGRGRIGVTDTLILLPQTYMNNSGTAVQKAMDFYKTGPGDLIVIHDEIELPFGEFRKKFGGGHKGQNGLRSIIQHTGTSDFHRLRFGVGRPENPNMSVADHVLSDFTSGELEKVTELLPGVKDLLESMISGS